MNKFVLSSFIFLVSPFCVACNSNPQYSVNIVQKSGSVGSFTYRTLTRNAIRGADFMVFFNPEKFYDFDNSNIIITIDDSPFPLPEGLWTFDYPNKVLKICGEAVTGKIKIEVDPQYGQYIFNIKYNDWNVEIDGSKRAGGEFETTIGKEYSKKDIVVTVTDEEFTRDKIKCESTYLKYYNDSKRTLTLPRDEEFYKDIYIEFLPK